MKGKRIIEFEHPVEIREIYKILKLAFDLNKEIKKYKLMLNHIPFEIVLDDFIMVSMEQKSIAAIDVDALLSDTRIDDLCQEILGIKPKINDSNT